MSSTEKQEYLSLDNNTLSARLYYNNPFYESYPSVSKSNASFVANNSTYVNYKSISFREQNNNAHYKKKNTRNNISLVISIIFSILCLLPAPVCSTIALVLTAQATKAGRKGNYRKKYQYSNCSLCLAVLTFIVGSLTICCISTGYAVLSAYRNN